MSFEIAEQLGWQIPDLVAVGVGDGCTIGAIGKGFRELVAIGRTARVPALLGVQSEAIQPLVGRFRGTHPATCTDETLATSIAVRRPRNAQRAIQEVCSSGGDLLAESDRELAVAQDVLSREAGIEAELAAAAGLAGLFRVAPHPAWQGRSAVVVITAGRSS